jgi:hypothetical protein
MELGIDKKKVTVFLAVTEDGIGHKIQATVTDQSLLHVDLVIKPVASTEIVE